MNETHLDPAADGIGFGVQDGDLTIAQISGHLNYLVGEARWRSFTAVLRLFREQSQGRASIAATPFFATVMGLLLAPAPLLALTMNQADRPRALASLGIVGVLVGVLGLNAYLTRDQRRRSVAQLKELRRLVLQSLCEISERTLDRPHLLDKERRASFRSLRSVDRDQWDRVAIYLVGDTV